MNMMCHRLCDGAKQGVLWHRVNWFNIIKQLHTFASFSHSLLSFLVLDRFN